MTLARFYRVPDWYRNMGIAAVGVLSAGPVAPLPAVVALLQVFLVQMHSFSMNDYYDHVFWHEDTAVGRALAGGMDRWQVYLLGHLPLAAALLLFPVSGRATWLLAMYAALFYLYQGPARLKRHYLSSLVLNAVPLGLILYLHPYLVAGGTMGPVPLFFAVLFTAYLLFYETAHQAEHRGEDVRSLVDRLGVEGAVAAGTVFLCIPAGAGIALTAVDPAHRFLYLVPAAFLVPRLWTLHRMETYGSIRRTWHKFYAAHEGLYYVTVLLLLG